MARAKKKWNSWKSGTAFPKREAQGIAKELRALGSKARVVPVAGGHKVKYQ